MLTSLSSATQIPFSNRKGGVEAKNTPPQVVALLQTLVIRQSKDEQVGGADVIEPELVNVRHGPPLRLYTLVLFLSKITHCLYMSIGSRSYTCGNPDTDPPNGTCGKVDCSLLQINVGQKFSQ